MGMMSSFLHPERAYQGAQDQLSNYYNQAGGYQQPYIQQGQQAYGDVSNVMQNFLNPQDMYSQWAGGYEASPYAQDMAGMATTQGMDAANAMGLGGSSSALQAITAERSRIMNADRQNYMQDLMNKYLTGANMAQGIYQGGQNASNIMSNLLMNQGNQMSELEYGKQAAPGELMGDILGAGAMAAGTALGGPIGGAVANKFIGSWR